MKTPLTFDEWVEVFGVAPWAQPIAKDAWNASILACEELSREATVTGYLQERRLRSDAELRNELQERRFSAQVDNLIQAAKGIVKAWNEPQYLSNMRDRVVALQTAIPQGLPNIKTLKPSTFRLGHVETPCEFWRSTGQHVVNEGLCRCGKKFMILEVE